MVILTVSVSCPLSEAPLVSHEEGDALSIAKVNSVFVLSHAPCLLLVNSSTATAVTE